MDITAHDKNMYLFEGILFLILGILAVFLPGATAISIALLLGWILLISGVIGLYHTFRNVKDSSFSVSLIKSIIAITIGILLIVFPLHGAMFLTLMLGIFFLFEGVTEIALSIHIRKHVKNWGWLLFSGILALFLSFIIWTGWPMNSVWILGLLVGINLIFFGFSLIMFSLTHKRIQIDI